MTRKGRVGGGQGGVGPVSRAAPSSGLLHSATDPPRSPAIRYPLALTFGAMSQQEGRGTGNPAHASDSALSWVTAGPDGRRRAGEALIPALSLWLSDFSPLRQHLLFRLATTLLAWLRLRLKCLVH